MSCIVRNLHARVSSSPPFYLDEISFSLKKGHILAVLGQSGAGKSSLLNALAGFLPIERGAIILQGKTVSCASFCLSPLERDIGYIFQNHNLLPHISLIENLTLGMTRQEKQRRMKEIEHMLQDLELVHLKETLPHEVSGGQQQRIALARAILHNKQLVLFDEPFSGLDQARMLQLAQIIKRSVKQYERMAVLVTHHIEEAFEIADVLAVMKDGKLVGLDTPENMYHTPPTLEIAQYVGPSTIHGGKRIGMHEASTRYGPVKIKQKLSASLNNIQILTRPDDYELEKGSTHTVSERTFQGMSQVVTVTDDTMSVKVLADHFQKITVGDKVGVKIRDDHPFMAYDQDGFIIPS